MRLLGVTVCALVAGGCNVFAPIDKGPYGNYCTAAPANEHYCGECTATAQCGYCPDDAQGGLTCPADPCASKCDSSAAGGGGAGGSAGGGGAGGGSGGGGFVCNGTCPAQCPADATLECSQYIADGTCSIQSCTCYGNSPTAYCAHLLPLRGRRAVVVRRRLQHGVLGHPRRSVRADGGVSLSVSADERRVQRARHVVDALAGDIDDRRSGAATKPSTVAGARRARATASPRRSRRPGRRRSLRPPPRPARRRPGSAPRRAASRARHRARSARAAGAAARSAIASSSTMRSASRPPRTRSRAGPRDRDRAAPLAHDLAADARLGCRRRRPGSPWRARRWRSSPSSPTPPPARSAPWRPARRAPASRRSETRRAAAPRHDARIGGVDAVDVAADLAVLGAERRRERDRGRVRAAAAERRDLALVRHALEAGDDHDLAARRARPRCGTAAPRRCARPSGGRWSGCRTASR